MVNKWQHLPQLFDEIVTGFRFAYGGAQEYYGVTPDLAAYGKAMGGGFPMAAVCYQLQFGKMPALEYTDDSEYHARMATVCYYAALDWLFAGGSTR